MKSPTAELQVAIVNLAATCGIRLTWDGPAGPEFDMPHTDAAIVMVCSGRDFMVVQDGVAGLAHVYEFGCDWDWTGPGNPITQPGTMFRRAIPVTDLPELLACLHRYRQQLDGVVPDGYNVNVSRWFVVAVAVARFRDYRIRTHLSVRRPAARQAAIRSAWRHRADCMALDELESR